MNLKFLFLLYMPILITLTSLNIFMYFGATFLLYPQKKIAVKANAFISTNFSPVINLTKMTVKYVLLHSCSF